MDDCHIIGWQRKLRHTHILLPMWACSRFATIYRPSPHETIKAKPLDIASSTSGACADIISLLSLTPEEAHSLGGDEMLRLYAPAGHWWAEMAIWIKSRSYADCHKFINEHDDELVREVLKYCNSNLLRQLACNSQIYSDSLVFLALRMIHRNPLSLTDIFKRFYGSPVCRVYPSQCVQRDPKRPPPHPQVHLPRPLPHPPQKTPSQTVC